MQWILIITVICHTLKVDARIPGDTGALDGRLSRTIFELLEDVEEPEKERSLVND